MNLRIFGKDLFCKLLLRTIFGSNLWSHIIKLKYLGDEEISIWYRRDLSWPAQGSVIWRSFQKILRFFRRNFIWKFHTGNKILIGLDPIMGIDSDPSTDPQLLSFLHQKGIFFWAQAIAGWKGAILIWKTGQDLGIEGNLAAQWNNTTWNMKCAGLYKSVDKYILGWQVKKGSCNIQVKDIYLALLNQLRDPSRNTFPFALWKVCFPTKIILFSWLVYHNRNLTWNNLQRRKWQGPSICMICLDNSEDNLHMFLLCPQTQLI